MEERRNSSALAMELSLSSTNPLMCETKLLIHSQTWTAAAAEN